MKKGKTLLWVAIIGIAVYIFWAPIKSLIDKLAANIPFLKKTPPPPDSGVSQASNQ